MLKELRRPTMKPAREGAARLTTGRLLLRRLLRGGPVAAPSDRRRVGTSPPERINRLVPLPPWNLGSCFQRGG